MKRIALIACLLLIYGNISADDFISKAKVDSVSKSGFYKVLLSPEIIAVSTSNYSDIRIFDAGHKEVPYLLYEEKPATERSGFREYTILENSYLPKLAITRVVVHNSTKGTISNLFIKVRNSDIEKEITLKGSDDQKNWYIIKRNFPVNALQYNGETYKMMELEFPSSNYEFFEITLNDKKKDPLQIMSIGYYDVAVSKGLFTEIPVMSVKQADSARKSYVILTFDRSYELSKLQLQVTGPAYYLRECAVGEYYSTHHRTGFRELGHFTLSSKSNAEWEFYKIKTNKLVIVIDNADNTPLQISSSKAFQLNKYLVAYLTKGEAYELYVGNNHLSAPEYDLKYFSDSIGANISVIKTSRLTQIASVPIQKKNTVFYKGLLWLSIAVVIALLAWFTTKIAREMVQNKQKE